jgi:molecular chaperone DnaK
MGKALGIDLGTTNSVVAFKDVEVKSLALENNGMEMLVRSCVAIIDPKSEPIVGNIPYKNLELRSPNAVVSVKRIMGGSINDDGVQKMIRNKTAYPFNITKLSAGTEDSVAIVMHGKEYTPEDISSMILHELKKRASDQLGEVTHAVITVPAYFNEKQKTATRIAAQKAGLKVQRLLSEPTAAAISYGFDKMKSGESKILLVYDFGGGTFDLSIIIASEGKFIESVTSGDRWLGGDDIDNLLSNWFVKQICKKYNIGDWAVVLNNLSQKERKKFNGELRLQIEDIKKQLTINQSAKLEIYSSLEDENGNPFDIEINITRDEFDGLIRHLIERTIELIDKLCHDHVYPIDTIDSILLVGGTSIIPLVKKMLANKYGADKIVSSEKPMLAIAEGAAILAHSLSEEFECPNCGEVLQKNQANCGECKSKVDLITNSAAKEDMVIHTTTHRYFIQLIDGNGNEYLEPILDNAIPLPSQFGRLFNTTTENQKIIKLLVFSDAENGTYDRIGIGFYAIPINIPENTEITIKFSMDVNQTMSVKAYPSGRNDLVTEIILTRGNQDARILVFLDKTLKDVLSSEEISENKKHDFIQNIQQIIEEINYVGNNSSENILWQNIELKILQAKNTAEIVEEDREIPYTYSIILLNEYRNLIDNTDYSSLIDLTSRYKSSNDAIQKQGLLIEMKEITDNYVILLMIYVIKFESEHTSNPSTAKILRDNYNEAIESLKNGDTHRALIIYKKSEPMFSSNSKKGLGGTNIRKK